MEPNTKIPEANSHQVTPRLTEVDSLPDNDIRPAGYNHNDNIGIGNPDWMGKLPDDIRISQISMVGTHDSMAFEGGDILACQTLPLATQLNAGVRALDIRCRNKAGVMAIYHNIQFEGMYLNDVLNTVVSFLIAHPSETILMRLSNEESKPPEDHKKEFDRVFFNTYWSPYEQYFWKYTNGNSNPKLSEVRGKIVLLPNFSPQTVAYGITWESSGMRIQDAYELGDNWDLYSKWEKVEEHLSKTNGDKAHLSFNFLSGSVGSFPYFVASGQSSPQNGAPRLVTGRTTPGWKDKWPDFPRIGCFIGICSIVFEGTNNLIINHIRTHSEIKHAGVVMCDFPGPDLITTIIGLNEFVK